MRTANLLFVLTLSLVTWSNAAGAQDSPLVGTWTANDPGSGQQEQLVITPDTLQFGVDEPAIPYVAERNGDTFTLFIGGPDNPARFTLLGADTAELAIPGGPTIALTRAAAAGEAMTTAGPPADGQEGHGVLDELTKVLVPYGVSTRYEPLNESLESLLSAGWKLDQAAGASGAFTLLLTNGGSNVLCILVPKNLGQADTALSDCRRLN